MLESGNNAAWSLIKFYKFRPLCVCWKVSVSVSFLLSRYLYCVECLKVIRWRVLSVHDAFNITCTYTHSRCCSSLDRFCALSIQLVRCRKLIEREKYPGHIDAICPGYFNARLDLLANQLNFVVSLSLNG